MTALSINRNQNQLLGEFISTMPQYDGMEVIAVLKKALAGLHNCTKVNSVTVESSTKDLSPEIESLIGIIPEFSAEELAADDRLRQILEH